MKKEDLHGYVPAIATPFNEKGKIMDDAFIELFEFLINRGATTICIACNANRGGTTVDQEFKQFDKGIVHDFALLVEGGCNGWHIAVKIFFFHGLIHY